jgi:hypothetical protein
LPLEHRDHPPFMSSRPNATSGYGTERLMTDGQSMSALPG